eukprot:14077-Heterococcus_DN1.PRE.3
MSRVLLTYYCLEVHSRGVHLDFCSRHALPANVHSICSSATAIAAATAAAASAAAASAAAG